MAIYILHINFVRTQASCVPFCVAGDTDSASASSHSWDRAEPGDESIQTTEKWATSSLMIT